MDQSGFLTIWNGEVFEAAVTKSSTENYCELPVERHTPPVHSPEITGTDVEIDDGNRSFGNAYGLCIA